MKIRVIKTKKAILENSLGNLRLFAWDSLWVYHPSVVKFEGRYYLFYTGKRIGRGIKHRIGVAVSSNLVTWDKLPQNPILKEGRSGEWDSDFVAHGFVFREKDKFYLLYDGSRKGNWREEIGLAGSKDLLNWRKYKDNPIFKVEENWWEKRHVSRSSLWKEKGIFYLFYAGHDGRRERIGVAKGENLFSLRRFLKRPVLDIGEEGEWDEESVSDPHVIPHKGKYLMFYSGADRKGRERTGIAESRDLVNWRKYQQNPIINLSPNSWDQVSASRTSPFIMNEDVCLFYSGKKRFFYKIGKAKLITSQ